MNLSFVPVSLHPSINCSEPLGGTPTSEKDGNACCKIKTKPGSKLSGALCGGAGKGRRACNHVSGIWIPPPIPLWFPVDRAVRFPPISANVNKHWKTRARGNNVITNVISANTHFASTFSNSRDVVESSPFFPAPPPECPGEVARRLLQCITKPLKWDQSRRGWGYIWLPKGDTEYSNTVWRRLVFVYRVYFSFYPQP